MKMNKNKDAKRSTGKSGGSLPSFIGKAIIVEAFLGQAKSGSGYLQLDIKTKDGTGTMKLWVTDAKGDTFTNYNGNIKEKRGFTIANDIALLVSKKSLDKQKTSEKSIKLGKDSVKIDLLPKWKGRSISVALQRCIENGQELKGKGKKAKWVNTKAKYTNTYLKEVFLPSKQTVGEKAAKDTGKTLYKYWEELVSEGDLDLYKKVSKKK